jgi:hypothetical protein
VYFNVALETPTLILRSDGGRIHPRCFNAKGRPSSAPVNGK